MGEMSFAEAAAMFTHMVAHKEHQKEALKEGAEILENEIKSAIGTYKYGWPALSPSTLAHKAADTPLYETGEYQKSFEHTVISDDEVNVGSNDRKAKWLEEGTSKMPPRPVIPGAIAAQEKKVLDLLTKAMLGDMKLIP